MSLSLAWRTYIGQPVTGIRNALLSPCKAVLPGNPLYSRGIHSPEFPSLSFPPAPDIEQHLAQTGLADCQRSEYQRIFTGAVASMDDTLQEHYREHLPLISVSHGLGDGTLSFDDYARAFQSYLHNIRGNSLERLWTTLIASIRQRYQLTNSNDANISGSSSRSSSPSSSCSSSRVRRGRPHVFTKEQTAVLRALLAHDDQYSTDEKEFIAQTLGLAREQVNRWFCNARARKKPYQKPKTPASLPNLLNRYKLPEKSCSDVLGSPQQATYSDQIESPQPRSVVQPAWPPLEDLGNWFDDYELESTPRLSFDSNPLQSRPNDILTT